MSWIDTIMLGYFKSAEVVGVYNAVYPLVGFLSLVIASMGFVYVPVTSKLWGQNNTATTWLDLCGNDQMVLPAYIPSLCTDIRVP